MSEPVTKQQKAMLAKMLGVKPRDIVLTPLVAAIHRVAISNERTLPPCAAGGGITEPEARAVRDTLNRVAAAVEGRAKEESES